jgi:hypothetical protein
VSWFNTQPQGEDGIGFLEMVVADLDGLFILIEHVDEFSVVDPVSVVDYKLVEEAHEAFLDEPLGLLQLNPEMQFALAFLGIDELLFVFLILIAILLLLIESAFSSHFFRVVLFDVLI